MFYYIEGTATHIEQNLAVIDCGGVGYACHTSQNTIASIAEGNKVRLYTYLHVKEDIFDLYGFVDMEELNCFKLLITISGVGPKAALSILSVAPPQRLALSIITGDEKMLTQAQGIGKKIAQRIVLELRDKMAKEQLQSAGKSTPITMPQNTGSVNEIQEAISALMVLGYAQAEAMNALEGIDAENIGAEEMIRYALKRLAKN